MEGPPINITLALDIPIPSMHIELGSVLPNMAENVALNGYTSSDVPIDDSRSQTGDLTGKGRHFNTIKAAKRE